MPRNLVVDGTSATDGVFAGDGELPPFVVFDVDHQENIAGPFLCRKHAEMHKAEILDGAEPILDPIAMRVWLEVIDESR